MEAAYGSPQTAMAERGQPTGTVSSASEGALYILGDADATRVTDAGAASRGTDAGAASSDTDTGAATRGADAGAATRGSDAGAATHGTDAGATCGTDAEAGVTHFASTEAKTTSDTSKDRGATHRRARHTVGRSSSGSIWPHTRGYCCRDGRAGIANGRQV